ncbi:hypothetical protein EMIHUDRAFT_441125 [Emiliania huxleyi CCMP1516]|uniref:Peptidase A2 domain-containing protein n=4 Tax=Emiliania huxleyi TaxID=2903 RepID=A0A0D3KCG1_EMIH1|nr:hypothetical protein EMIHUDRAFT_364024 [Emiliania huxleyi CCMP1516]XP_005787268.1 hypothetical protein EMIHUDRAFT_441125 [Emiliania huxleyi CCMP1516]EOD33446.1 hypothetical protein EMIHUDRAFT_364024 [Emiliania huxleyi CCMP1516]EOD34839.1 hypothetical protein EMIHUDRAFT_441125 [Emiliania huxleyi CCMP1516]|eukprot:XP_005785875.1 hypothetical protein EMIHUDRAFT_364024 [Emiliania huxleyi CCMP1516]
MRCAVWVSVAFTSLASALSRAQPKPFRASEIKARLRRLGVSTEGCFEKEELYRLLLERAPEASGVGHCVPLELLQAARGAMGAGVTVDSKRYVGIRLASADDASVADPRLLMLLDSAASNSLLTPAAARLLGARPTGVRATADTGTAVGLGGFEQVDLGEVALPGGLACGRLAPVVMDLPLERPSGGGECGLLGLDFLSRFEVELCLRPLLPTASFYPLGSAADGAAEKGKGSAALPTDGLSCLPLERLQSGLIATRVELTAPPASPSSPPPPPARALAIVDLGSSTTVANPAAASAAGFDLSRGDPRVAATDQVLAGATGVPVRVSEATATLGLGGAPAGLFGSADAPSRVRRETTLAIADLPVFDALGLGDAPAMVLGLDVIAPGLDEGEGSRVVLAAGAGRMWVDRDR